MSDVEIAKKLLGLSFLPGAYTLEDKRRFTAISEALAAARAEGRKEILESEELKVVMNAVNHSECGCKEEALAAFGKLRAGGKS